MTSTSQSDPAEPGMPTAHVNDCDFYYEVKAAGGSHA